MNRFLRIESLRTLLLALIVGTMFTGIVSAQNKNNVSEITEGKEYYFAIPHCAKEPAEGVRGAASVELWVSSKKTTKVFGRCNGLGTTFQANISPNKVHKIALSDDYMNKINETVQNLGVHVTSTEPVSLTVFVSYRWSGEAYRVIPAVWLGKSYRTLNLYQDETDEIKPSQILITATQDKTSITYVPSCNTQKVKKGEIGQITLNKGQTFLIHNEKRSSYTHIDGDLTGTLVTADKPIAVISGHTKGAFPRYSQRMLGRPANFMRNMLIDMLWPEELLGTEYVSAPILYTNRYVRNIDPDDIGDLIRFVAIKDKTIIQQMRQDGTGYKTVSKSLKAGEYFELTNMELSAAYKSNFPVLVGHYGKAWRNQFITSGVDKGENPDNPSRNGCGMMMVLVPKERWCSYAVFHSPNGLDNFMYMTFRAADENALKFDNVPLRSKFGGGIKAVPGTEYSYVAAQISAGDHTIEGAPFAAYAYGNWDYTKDGFAYGYPTGFNMATPCDDSVALEGTGPCGNIKGTATALPDNLECAKLFAIEMIADSSSNYIFNSKPDFGPKGKQGTFELTVEDLRRPARALVRAITMSGKFVTQWFNYEPEMLVADPKIIDFGSVAIGDTQCRVLTLRNDGKVPVTITDLKQKFSLREFFVKDLTLPIIIEPQKTLQIQVCGTAYDAGKQFDSLIAQLSCYPEPIAELRLQAFVPIVHVSDLDFGKLPKNATRRLVATIRNARSEDVIVTGVQPYANTKHFPQMEQLTYPFVLKAGKTKEFWVEYTPAGEVGVKHTERVWFTANTTKDKLYSDWVGEGEDVEIYVTGHDWKERRVLDNFVTEPEKSNGYEFSIELGTTGNAPLFDAKLEVLGTDGNYFTVPTTSVPTRLDPNTKYGPYKVYFKPEWVVNTRNGERPYEVTLRLSGKDGGADKSATNTLKGIGVQPHITMTPQIDFGTLEINTTSPIKYSTITSDGSMILTLTGTITDIRIEGTPDDVAAFKIDETFVKTLTMPFTIPTGETLDLPITFNPTIADRNYTAILKVNHDAPETVQTELLGKANVTSEKSGTIAGFDINPILTCGTREGIVVFNNTSKDNVDATFPNPPVVSGKDAQYFTALDTKIEKAVQNGKQEIRVNFSPDAARTYEANLELEVVWVDQVSGLTIGRETFIAQMTGEGRNVTSLITAKESEIKTVNLGEIAKDIPVYLNDDNLNEVGIYQFKIRVKFDPDVIYPHLGADKIKTAGTLTDGFVIDKATMEPGKNNEFYIEFSSPANSTQTLQASKDKSSNVLFRFDALALLDEKLTSVIDPYELNIVRASNPDVNSNPNGGCITLNYEPGTVRVNPACAPTLRPINFSGQSFDPGSITRNPVDGEATIKFSVGLEANTSIHVYDVNGNLVATVLNQLLKPGQYESSFNVSDWGSGLYQYRIVNGPYNAVNSFIVNH